VLAATVLAATALAAPSFTASAGAATAVAPQTTQGTDFWLTFEGNYDGGSNLYLFAAGDTATSGTVSEPGISFSQTFTVTPGTVTQVTLPSDGQDLTSDTVGDYGIHVTADAPVSVYGLNTEEYTTDGFLGLPTDILGQHYIVEAYTNDIGYGSQFSVVGTANGTNVTIVPSETVGDHQAGTPYTVQLNQGQTYQLNDADVSGGDLTGTDITSDQPVAVFGGNNCADVPPGYVACNTLTEELTPVTAWGTSFVTEPLATRSADTFRFLASEDDTTVQVNGTTVATLNAHAFFETTLSAASVITSDKPIFVTQFSNGGDYDGTQTDPFSVTIPPYGQFLNSYTVTTEPDGADPAIDANYINVVAPTSEVGSVTLDGAAIPASDFSAIGGSSFSGAQVPVAFGSHVLSGSLPFGITVYGFGDYDGYGYPGGFTLSPIAVVSNVSLALGGGGTAPVGGTATATATVTDQNGNPLEGVRVDFTVTGANAQTGFAYTDASGNAVFTYTGGNAGTDTITAAVQSIMSSPVTFTWTAPAPTTLTTRLAAGQSAGTSVTVPAGTAVTDSAALSGTNVPQATGTVTYSVYSNAACTTLAKSAGSVTVTNGLASSSAAVTLTTPGTYYWQASYSGDSLNEASSSACGAGGEVETVTAAPTTLATSLSGGESSGTAISVPAGTAVTDSATLSGAVASAATGTVTYTVYSDSACTRQVGGGTAQSISTPGTLPASGAVTLSTPGTYYWTASYSGDASNLASSSSCGSETVAVSSVATPTSLATTLTGGARTGTAITVPAGTAVTDSATLSGTSAATATGTVTYNVYSDSACTKLVKAGTAEHITTPGTLPASAAVTLSAAGTYYWQAAYSGDASNQAADSTCGTETATVTAASTTLATSLSGGGHTGTSITLQAGTPVTDSATLSGAVAATATGTVTFNVYSNSTCTTLAASSGRESVSAGKAASAAVTLTKAGTYYWTASYSGDASDLASASACGSEKLTVNPLPSIDTLTTAWGKGSAAAKVSTSAAGDLVVAFVAATGPGNKHQSSTVTGGGLTWHLTSRQNPGGSDTEVWTATASGKLTRATVTARASIGGYDVVISVVTFKNASGAGPESFTSSAKAAPHGTLKTTVANTWVFALGADWATYAEPTAAKGQLIISNVDAPGSKTVWLQAAGTLTATSGTSVTISDTKPTTHPYDLLLVGIH
jgi:IgGFc binding protein/Bacterial Ig-like domain (group 1)